MPLGIESNNIAPQLIQNSGAALVQGIRQIGQQISGHLTELQTKRDLGALAQELQGINVQSNEFPVQLTQMLSRHPLAARDERGQLALSMLGKAHGQWQAEEAELRAFNRGITMAGIRSQLNMNEAAAADERTAARRKAEAEERLGMPQNIGGALVIPKDPETGQPNVLLPAPSRGSTALPFASSPAGIYDRRTGEIKNPSTGKQMTEYQKAQVRRNERKDKISAINQEINQLDSDIASAVRQYESSFDREQKATEEAEKLRHQKDKTEIGTIADQLKAKKTERLKLLEKLRQEDANDAAVAEDEAAAAEGEVLPAVSAGAAELPVLTPAQAAQQPPGTQFRDKNGNVRTVPPK